MVVRLVGSLRSDTILPSARISYAESVRNIPGRLDCVTRSAQTDLFADFYRVLDALESQLGAAAAAILLPAGSEDQLDGQIDVLAECCATCRTRLIHRLADLDDEIADCVLNGWIQTLPNRLTN